MTTGIFVYGTLMPGQPRWPILAAYADPDRQPARAQTWGILYDTTWGWPAAVLGKGTDSRLLPGFVVDLHPEQAEFAMAELDEIEGVEEDLFQRIRVLANGQLCWAYHWPGNTEGFALVEAWA